MSELKHRVNLINGSVHYISLFSEEGMGAKLAQQEIPAPNETFDNKTPEETQTAIPLIADLSVRNYKNTYIIPTEKERVLVNFIPQKIFVVDTDINSFIDTTFNYFIDDYSEGAPPEPYDLIDGIIFRYVESGPKSIDQYTYYIMEDGEVKQIPNFKTLEVMLFQRNENYNSVRILERSQFEDLVNNNLVTDINDMSAVWKAEMEDQVNFGKYLDLTKDAKAAGEIAAAATAEADKNINAYKAERDAEKAKAEQAKAEAEAAKAAAEAAKAAAAAAEAQAKQAEAEAKQKQAEADREKAEWEAQNSGT